MNIKLKNIEGKIIRGIGGFYYVKPTDSLFTDKEIECKPRGKFRHQGIKPTVGDLVELFLDEQEQWSIETIFPRENRLVRPPVSNVDQAIICIAVKEPDPDLFLLDKLINNALCFDIEPLICFTKTDLDEETGKKLQAIYKAIGFDVFLLSNSDSDDLNKLLEKLVGKTAFLAGPSGAGKSTLSNRFCENQMETGSLSQKLGRGKHTTRHVELLQTNVGSFLLDTPGFGSLDLEMDINPENLKLLYPEFEGLDCRFSNCNHIKEPGCKVRESVKEGKINKERYLRYKKMFSQLQERKSY